MNNDVKSSNEYLKADIVIIGGGGAGLPAAVAASEAGVKNIILLEARGVLGGNAVYGAGIFAVETSLQKRSGLDVSEELMFNKTMEYAHWKTNPRLVRTLINKSTDTINWLEEKGVKFTRLIPHFSNQMPATFHASKGPRITGVTVVKTLAKICQDLGVRVLYHTKAEKIITNNEGNVSGVIAVAKDKELRIDTRSVIIATGGFDGNVKLLKKYLPNYNDVEVHHLGIRHKGDGLRMATDIGAAVGGMVTPEWEGPDFPAKAPFSYLGVVTRRPQTIWINKNGERFINEAHFSTFEVANAMYRQREKTSYTLFDEGIKGVIGKDGLSPLDDYLMGSRLWPTKLDKDLESQTGKGLVKISNSWDEIADWIGINTEVLKSTIDEYNSYCYQGCDRNFSKDRRYLLPLRQPPYYAIKCCIKFLVTHGGIKINHNMEVLSNQDTPISGLYAAGVDTEGVDSDTYNIFLTGHSFGFSINSGRIAGENAARYVLG